MKKELKKRMEKAKYIRKYTDEKGKTRYDYYHKKGRKKGATEEGKKPKHITTKDGVKGTWSDKLKNYVTIPENERGYKQEEKRQANAETKRRQDQMIARRDKPDWSKNDEHRKLQEFALDKFGLSPDHSVKMTTKKLKQFIDDSGGKKKQTKEPKAVKFEPKLANLVKKLMKDKSNADELKTVDEAIALGFKPKSFEDYQEEAPNQLWERYDDKDTIYDAMDTEYQKVMKMGKKKAKEYLVETRGIGEEDFDYSEATIEEMAQESANMEQEMLMDMNSSEKYDYFNPNGAPDDEVFEMLVGDADNFLEEHKEKEESTKTSAKIDSIVGLAGVGKGYKDAFKKVLSHASKEDIQELFEEVNKK